MFEKDAESKAIETCPSKLDMPTYCQGFSDGYHECQKEHEWHYVKDGDLPKVNELVLIKITGCFVLGWTNGTNWFNDSNNGTIIDRRMVYAWKEIVLPELKESE